VAEGFYADVVKELARMGFAFWKSAKGSHEKWRSAETGVILIVPRILKSRHTANGILKDAGSTKRL
jgi:predicted RNA binding protein YcfA (HicA-like mRNA interferase family)